MRKLLLVLLFPFAAHAQTIPNFGCFVSQSNPTTCSGEFISCTADTVLNYSNYGAAVGNVCDRLATCASDVTSVQNQLAVCDKAFQALDSAHATIFARLQASDALVKKLKRACGKACKRIR